MNTVGTTAAAFVAVAAFGGAMPLGAQGTCNTGVMEVRSVGQKALTGGTTSTRGFGLTLGEDMKQFNPFAPNEDRNYTGGVGVTLPSGIAIDRPFRWALNLVEARLLQRCKAVPDGDVAFTAENMTVALTAFTPDSLGRADVIRGDRPYSSTLLVTARRLRVRQGYRTAFTTEFTGGVLGLHLARNLQRYIHKLGRQIDDDLMPLDPKGWGNQISDGGEPTALLTVGVEHLLGSIGNARASHLADVTVRGQANAGYYTDAMGGMNLRVGYLNSGFYSFIPSAISNAVNLVAASDEAGSGRNATAKPDVFLFLQGRGRGTLYNALLQGQLRNTRYRVTDFRRLTAEWDVGAGVKVPIGREREIRGAWTLQSGRTSELFGPYDRSHTWGTWAFSVAQRLPY